MLRCTRPSGRVRIETTFSYQKWNLIEVAPVLRDG